jgi:hypothetical protein
VLAAAPGVAACAVGVATLEGAAQLVAYVVASGAPVAEAALRDHLTAVLPEALIPRVFVALGALPRTANGKLDRAALPAPISSAAAGAAPGTAMEALVAEIWERLLKRERIGAHDNFFALGGHSLLARVETSPGDHRTMVMPPHATALGAQLRRWLAAR